MSLRGLTALLSHEPGFDRVSQAAAQPLAARASELMIGAVDGIRPVLLAEIAEKVRRAGETNSTVLAVVATEREAEDTAAALESFLPAEEIALFPAWETLPHERLSPRTDTVGQRVSR